MSVISASEGNSHVKNSDTAAPMGAVRSGVKNKNRHPKLPACVEPPGSYLSE